VRDVNETNPGHLAQLLTMAPDESVGWRADDLGAILRHQLSVPVEFELPRDGGPGGDRLPATTMPLGVRAIFTTTFADLLRHPDPPLAMLRRVKDFAKACRDEPRGPLPREVAMVLYLASIFAALTRRGVAITKLGSDELRKAAEWGLAQQWLDDSTRSLFKEALSRLNGGPGGQLSAPSKAAHQDEHGTHGHANR
jgi:hypothetical protein